MRIALAQINSVIGDLENNTDKIIQNIEAAKQQNVDIVLFPELAITGYPPDDLLLLPNFINALPYFLEKIRRVSQNITTIVGTPRLIDGKSEKALYNSAAVFSNGELLGFQDKTLLPTYDVFSERRYFDPATTMQVWLINGKKIAITICEDIWQHSSLVKQTTYLRDPVLDLKKLRPDLVLNLSASPFSEMKPHNRLAVCQKVTTTLNCPILLCNQVGSNDELIFDGYSLHVNSNGRLLHYAKGFEEDFLIVDLDVPKESVVLDENRTELLYRALVLGVKDYFHKQGFKKACVGLSGGIDSALVACIAVDALGSQNVLGVSMPSRYSSEGSLSDAQRLARNLGITYRVIPIESPFQSFLDILQPHFENRTTDVTEENLQARIRGTTLMALSNKLGYIVLSTGNKSELAMGYSTLYGDMVGGLGVLSDVRKGQIYEIAKWINNDREIIPWNTINKPPSAELRYNQKDSDSLPPYEMIDNVVKSYVEEHLSPKEIMQRYLYSEEEVSWIIKRIHSNEYKRRQSAPGLRVSEKAFTSGRRFPIVQKWV